MRGIGKALENYHPHYQAIEQLNKGLSNDLNKFYERYPQFKEIGDQLTGTFKVQNEYLTHIVFVFFILSLKYLDAKTCFY